MVKDVYLLYLSANPDPQKLCLHIYISKKEEAFQPSFELFVCLSGATLSGAQRFTPSSVLRNYS